MVVSVVVDDLTEHAIDPAIRRSELLDVGQHVAQLAGYTLDCDTFQLTPIDATNPQT